MLECFHPSIRALRLGHIRLVNFVFNVLLSQRFFFYVYTVINRSGTRWHMIYSSQGMWTWWLRRDKMISRGSHRGASSLGVSREPALPWSIPLFQKCPLRTHGDRYQTLYSDNTHNVQCCFHLSAFWYDFGYWTYSGGSNDYESTNLLGC